MTPGTSAEFEGGADPAASVYLEAQGHRARAVAVADVGGYLGHIRGRGEDVDRPDGAALLGAAGGGGRGQTENAHTAADVGEHHGVGEAHQLTDRAIAGKH